MDRSTARSRLRAVVLVGAGGFAGAVLRHAIDLALAGPGSIPATVATNVAGAFLLGLLVTEGHLGSLLSRRLRLLSATGFLSSFTTYSTFAHQTATAAPATAVTIVVTTYGFGLGAVALGASVARWAG